MNRNHALALGGALVAIVLVVLAVELGGDEPAGAGGGGAFPSTGIEAPSRGEEPSPEDGITTDRFEKRGSGIVEGPLLIDGLSELVPVREPVGVRVRLVDGRRSNWLTEARLGLDAPAEPAFWTAVRRHHERLVRDRQERMETPDAAAEDAERAAALLALEQRMRMHDFEGQASEGQAQLPEGVEAKRFSIAPVEVVLTEGVATIDLVRGSRLRLHWLEVDGERIVLPGPLEVPVPVNASDEVVFEVKRLQAFVLHVVAAESGDHLRDVSVDAVTDMEASWSPLRPPRRPLVGLQGDSPFSFCLGDRSEEEVSLHSSRYRHWLVSAPRRVTASLTLERDATRIVVSLERAATLDLIAPSRVPGDLLFALRDVRDHRALLREDVLRSGPNRLEDLPARELMVLVTREALVDENPFWATHGEDESGAPPVFRTTVRLRAGEVTTVDLSDVRMELPGSTGTLRGRLLLPASVADPGLSRGRRGEDRRAFVLVPDPRLSVDGGRAIRSGRSLEVRAAWATEVGAGSQVITIPEQEHPVGAYWLQCRSTGHAVRVDLRPDRITEVDADFTRVVAVTVDLHRPEGRKMAGEKASLRLAPPGAGAAAFFTSIPLIPGPATRHLRPGSAQLSWSIDGMRGREELILGGVEQRLNIAIPDRVAVKPRLLLDGKVAAWPRGWRIQAEPLGIAGVGPQSWKPEMRWLQAGRWRFRLSGTGARAFEPQVLDLTGGMERVLTFAW